MYSRVLYKDGCYIPQMRPMLWPTWFNISDTIFEEESEKLDCYNNELDPRSVAEDCAKRYVGNYRDYQGIVTWMPLLARWLKIFQGPPGMQGAMGCVGMSGRDGVSRGPLDLQCPNCKKFLTDEPAQDLLLEVLGDHKFKHKCPRCESSSEWTNFSGLLVPTGNVVHPERK